MKNDGVFDMSIFEAVMKPYDKYRTLTAAEIKKTYPKGYQILSEIGKTLKFSTDDDEDVTPISEDTEKLFTKIEAAETPGEFMASLMVSIGPSCETYVTYTDLKGISQDANVLKTIENSIRRLFIKTVI